MKTELTLEENFTKAYTEFVEIAIGALVPIRLDIYDYAVQYELEDMMGIKFDNLDAADMRELNNIAKEIIDNTVPDTYTIDWDADILIYPAQYETPDIY